MEKDNLVSRWSTFFINKYKATLLIVVAIIIAGIWGVLGNQRQDFPSIPSNYIGVSATYIGASGSDVEKEVVIPIEQAIGDMDEINNIRSFSSDNFGMVSIELKSVDDINGSLEKIDKEITQASLPGEVEIDTKIIDAIGPALVYAISSDQQGTDELLNYAEIIKSELLSASSDVREIEIIPKNEFEIVVEYKSDALEENNILAQDITQVVKSALTSIPGGALLTEDKETLSISVEPAAHSLNDLKAITINDVRLDKLAYITRRPVEYDQLRLAGYIENNEPVSKPAIYLFAYKNDDGDVIRMAEQFSEIENNLIAENVLPNTVTFTKVLDNSEYVQKQISDLLWNGWLGLILILLVLMLFINLRTGITVAAIIPLAFLGTLGILYAIGFSINILTLFGLLLVLGILVDNAIVIAEGVVHGIEQGKTKKDAVLSTMRNLGPAITAATLTTVIVFIPFASIGGIIGEFLKYIPYTIIIMLLVSYGLAITITPLLSRYIMKQQTRTERRNRKLKTWHKIAILPAILFYGQSLVDWLEDSYVKFSTAIHHRIWRKLLVTMATIFLIGWSILSYGVNLPFQQFPTDDGNVIEISFQFPAGTDYSVINESIQQYMEQAIELPYFQSYLMLNSTQVMIILAEPDQREPGNDMYALLDDLNFITTNTRENLEANDISIISHATGVGPPKEAYDVVVELRGTEMIDLQNAANDLAIAVSKQPGVIETHNEIEEEQTDNVAISFNQAALYEKNIDPLIVNGIINQTFSKQTVGSIVTRQDGVSDDVVIEFDKDIKRSADDIRELVVGIDINTYPPQTVTVGDIANVETVSTLETTNRLNQMHVAELGVRVQSDEDIATVDQYIHDYLTTEHLAEFNLEADDVVYGGVTASLDESFNNLVLVVILAMIFVYLVLVYQFNSFVQPGLIMFTIPMALIGVFPALTYIGGSVDMISGLGIVALVGIVVNDAIVFVDYYNRIRKDHPDWEINRTLVETGRARFKPILSTSITTIFGVLPLTLNDPFWRGLGTSLIAGLVFSTLGTLIVFPILLSWTNTFFNKCKWCTSFIKKRLKRS